MSDGARRPPSGRDAGRSGSDGTASAAENGTVERPTSDGDPTARTARSPSERGQLVLVAAAVVAVALIPIVFAYAQLGYGGIATTEPTATTPEHDAVDALERAAFESAADEQGRTAWANRSDVATAVRDRFDERAAAVEESDLTGARLHDVERNDSAAADWAADACPGGPGREFGPCEADAGLVLQERAGDAHVVAVAVDLRTVTEDGTYGGVYVLDATVGDGRRFDRGG